MSDPMNERRHGDSVVLVISEKLEGLERNLTKVNNVLDRLTDAVSKLSIIEERQIQANSAMDRAFREIEKNSAKCDFHHTAQIAETKLLMARVNALEQSAPENKQTSTWVASFITGLAVLAMLFVASKVGLT